MIWEWREARVSIERNSSSMRNKYIFNVYGYKNCIYFFNVPPGTGFNTLLATSVSGARKEISQVITTKG
jgi:hypothetical protein